MIVGVTGESDRLVLPEIPHVPSETLCVQGSRLFFRTMPYIKDLFSIITLRTKLDID